MYYTIKVVATIEINFAPKIILLHTWVNKHQFFKMKNNSLKFLSVVNVVHL